MVDFVANQAELAWLTHFSLPRKLIVDRGNEFLINFRGMISNNYGIKVRPPITTKNPQANTLLDRVHQTIGNILCTFKIQNMSLDDKNPWDGKQVSTMFALRTTVHPTKLYFSTQLVFGRDSIINQLSYAEDRPA